MLTQSITTAVSRFPRRRLAAVATQSTHIENPLDGQLNAVQVLFATGDVLAQQAVERVGIERHSLARTGRMAVYGGGMAPSPMLFYH